MTIFEEDPRNPLRYRVTLCKVGDVEQRLTEQPAALASVDPGQIRQHLELVWGYHQWPAGAKHIVCAVTSWVKDGKPVSVLGRATPVPAAAGDLSTLTTQIATAARANRDCWITVGVTSPDWQPQSKLARGGASDICAIPALIVDIDVAGEGHKNDGLPSLEEAHQLLDRIESTIGVRCGLVVHTGGGLHGWVLLSELIHPAAPAHKDLLPRWKVAVVAAADELGVAVDEGVIADVARVLRPAGSLNCKTGTPRPVRTLAVDETARYSLADLDRMLPALPPRPQPVVLPRPQFAAPSMAGHAGLAERIGDIWNRMVPADVLLQERGLVPVNAAGYWQFPGAAPDERFRYRTFADGSVQCFGSRAAAVFPPSSVSLGAPRRLYRSRRTRSLMP